MAVFYLLETSGLKPVFDRFLPDVEPERRDALIQSGPTRTALCRLGAGLLVRTVLARYWGLHGIQRTESGQPYLPGAPFFSISHSGSYVLLGVSEMPIGVDIQEKRPAASLSLADRFFHPEEIKKIRSNPDPDSVFFSIWAAKESYVKAESRGFSLPFSSFCLIPGPSGIFTVQVPSGSPYHVVSLPVPERYSGAACSQDSFLNPYPETCFCNSRAPFGIDAPPCRI